TPIPHSLLSVESLRHTDFSHYRVLVLPDGDYGHLDKNTILRLQAWVKGGGTVVAVKGASGFVRGKDVELSKLKTWDAPKKGKEKDKDKDKDKDKEKEEEKPEEDRYNQYRVPGAAFRTEMSTRSYLTFGVPRAPMVLIEGTAAYQPV